MYLCRKLGTITMCVTRLFCFFGGYYILRVFFGMFSTNYSRTYCTVHWWLQWRKWVKVRGKGSWPIKRLREARKAYIAVHIRLSRSTIRSSLLVRWLSTKLQPRSNRKSLSNQPIEFVFLLVPFIFYLSRYNTTKSLYFALYYSAIMPAVSQFLIKNLLILSAIRIFG